MHQSSRCSSLCLLDIRRELMCTLNMMRMVSRVSARSGSSTVKRAVQRHCVSLRYMCHLFDLIHHVDPVSPELAASTPLFRDPTNGGRTFTVDAVREEIRALMCGIGRVGTLYGAHSMRIGGATALAFLGAAPEAIKAHGRWRSDAYMRYVRERERECMFYTRGICGADVDDYEADYLDFEAGEISDSDLM